MGYYIETGTNKGKAEIICEKHGGEIIECPLYFSEIPDDKALICVVDNGIFEAAGYCYSESEFHAFTELSDHRPKTWLIMEKEKAIELSQS